MITRFITLGLLLWLSAGAWSQEAVPPLVNYQGRLLGAGGANVPNGSYDIEFRIWSAGIGGTAVWGRSFSVTVNEGIFNVVLGEGGSPLPGVPESDIRQAFNDRERYLGLTVVKDHGAPVDNPQEIAPRQQFLSTPFAIAAKDAAELGGVPAAQYAQVGSNETLAARNVSVTNLTVSGKLEAFGTVPVGGIIMWRGSLVELPPGWALCDGQNGTPNLQDRFILGWGKRNPDATGGAETHALTVDEMPSHAHNYSFSTVGYRASWNGSSEAVGSPWTGRNNAWGSRATDAAGKGTAFPVMPPYYVLAFIQRVK